MIRRIPCDRWKFDQNRPNRHAFNIRKNKEEKYLSVYLADEVTVDDVIAEYPGDVTPGIVSIKVGDIRALELGFKIRREPQDSRLPGHCGIHGRFTKSNRKKM